MLNHVTFDLHCRRTRRTPYTMPISVELTAPLLLAYARACHLPMTEDQAEQMMGDRQLTLVSVSIGLICCDGMMVRFFIEVDAAVSV